jgi:hypothetical protein
LKSVVRWSVAGLVTVFTFSTATWICGALVLRTMMKDPAVRWGVAAGLGVAVAALAALWGESFANGEKKTEGIPSATSALTAQASSAPQGGTHNEISGGIFHGPVFQGRNFSGSQTVGTALPQDPDAEAGD